MFCKGSKLGKLCPIFLKPFNIYFKFQGFSPLDFRAVIGIQWTLVVVGALMMLGSVILFCVRRKH
jgi:hypothetical protein